MTQPLKASAAPARFESYCADLSAAFARIAEMHGILNSVALGKKQARITLRAIDRKKDEKLQNWLYQTQRIIPWERRPYKPSIEWAAMLVRLKRNEQRIGLSRDSARLSRAVPIEDASSIKFAELRPVEKRAVELLCGKRPKPKKNLVEARAIRLADAVRSDWFTKAGEIGRPKGTHSQKIGIEGSRYKVPLSMAEVIAIVKPLVEDFSGTAVMTSISKIDSVLKISSLTFAALVAAIQIVLPEASIESINRLLARNKGDSWRPKVSAI